MSNPYINDQTPTPPQPQPVKSIPWTAIALVVAVAGCFLPSTQSCSVPFPVPPFVEPVVDPAKTEGSWVIVIEETSDRTPERAKLLNANLWRELESRGLKYRHYDQDAPDAAAYKVMVDEFGVPLLLIIDAKGKVLAEQKLPSSIEALDAAIKEATGR